MSDRARRALPFLGWSLTLVAAHVVLLPTREPFGTTTQVTLVFLLIVLGGSASGARGLGMTLAIVGFLLIDYSYQVPYGTLGVAKSPDWVVLLAFLATASVATSLVRLARDAAEKASARADEISRLTTQAKRAAALEEADRLKDALLASVSHDLRTPLTTIRALAAEHAAESPGSAEIVTQVDRLDHMVRDLLDLSRVTAGPAAVPGVNVAEDLIGASLRQLAALLRDRTVVTEIENDMLLVGRFDFEQTLRALTNIIENAVKYSPAGEPVRVVARSERSSLAIDVMDRGVGVPEGEELRIFTPFYRPPHVPPDAGSAGLGLAIARRIVEAQGGSITFCRREGGGSVFTLRLPRAAEEPAPDVGAHPSFTRSR